MEINWRKCESYDDASDYRGVIYLHEWDGEPFYWGKAHRSFFGGHRRTRSGVTAAGRYASGYRHWIEGCLRHGARLYIGVLDRSAVERIDEIEQHLISTHPSEMNCRTTSVRNCVVLEHTGDVPLCLGHVAPQCR